MRSFFSITRWLFSITRWRVATNLPSQNTVTLMPLPPKYLAIHARHLILELVEARDSPSGFLKGSVPCKLFKRLTYEEFQP
jgi:hypothetical protein